MGISTTGDSALPLHTHSDNSANGGILNEDTTKIGTKSLRDYIEDVALLS